MSVFAPHFILQTGSWWKLQREQSFAESFSYVWCSQLAVCCSWHYTRLSEIRKSLCAFTHGAVVTSLRGSARNWWWLMFFIPLHILTGRLFVIRQPSWVNPELHQNCFISKSVIRSQPPWFTLWLWFQPYYHSVHYHSKVMSFEEREKLHRLNSWVSLALNSTAVAISARLCELDGICHGTYLYGSGQFGAKYSNIFQLTCMKMGQAQLEVAVQFACISASACALWFVWSLTWIWFAWGHASY